MGANKSKQNADQKQSKTPKPPSKPQSQAAKHNFEIVKILPRYKLTGHILVICSNSFNEFLIKTFTTCHFPYEYTFCDGSKFFTDYNKENSLEQFDGILVDVFCNSLSSTAAVSDLLAAYSNSGRGLVLCCATNCSKFPNHSLQSSFKELEYHPLLFSDRYFNSATQKGVSLGKIHEPLHPILKNVKTFETSCNPEYVFCDVHPRATRVADFECGEPLIATKVNTLGNSMIVALNFGAPCKPSYWNEQSDGHYIICNAIQYSIGQLNTEHQKTRMLAIMTRKLLVDITIEFMD